MLVRSLRWVPPTTALFQRRTTKRLLFWPCPAIGLVDGNNSRTNGREKTRALYPRLERRGFTAHSVKILNEGLLRGEIRQPGTVTVSYDEKPGIQAMAQ